MTDLKLVAIDLDGTLLTDRQAVSPRNLVALEALLARDVVVVLASARDQASMSRTVGLTRPGFYFISSGGVLVFETATHSIFWDNYLSRGEVEAYFSYLRRYNYPVFLNTENDYWVDRRDERVQMIEERYALKAQLIHQVDDITRPIMRISLAAPVSVLEQAADAKSVLGQRVNVSLASPDWLDLLPLESGKGAALKILQSRLGIDPEDTMAIGDYDCDLQMFDRAKHRIAMGNAVASVKAAATYITASNNADGVAEALQLFL
jgi:Cof subfamily protein (haloacid dehalogenase superfamily)